MAHTKLLPCPFCGEKPTIGIGGPGYRIVYVTCNRDDANHSICIQGLGRKAAIAAWNTRASDPRIAAAEGLAKALDMIQQAYCNIECERYPDHLGECVTARAARASWLAKAGNA